jgi:hypothetical protein
MRDNARMRRAVSLPVLIALAAGCGKPDPPPPPSSPKSFLLAVASGSLAPHERDAGLTCRTLVEAGPNGALRPGSAASWSSDPSRRRWTFETPEAGAWAARWLGPGRARAEYPSRLVVELDAPDPELPARVAVLRGPANGGWQVGPRSMSRARSLVPRDASRPALSVALTSDLRGAFEGFQRGEIARIDGIPSDKAAGWRAVPGFSEVDTAATLVLVLDVADDGARHAIAAALDPATVCRRAYHDPGRAATRLAPPVLGLPVPPAARPLRAGRVPAALTWAADQDVDTQLAATPVRGALRQAGSELSEPEPGVRAQVSLVLLEARSPAPADFFAPLRSLARARPELAQLFDALDSSLDPAERAEWYRALEGALLDSRLVVPLARGRAYALASPACPVEVDAFGRYRPKSEGEAAR